MKEVMMLKDLLKELDYELIQGDLYQDVLHLEYDSQKVKEGSLFICIKGFHKDGHHYINQAIENGAKMIVVEKDVEYIDGMTYIKVQSTRYALALLSCAFFENPSHKMKVIGITGTKGKTTLSFMIDSILRRAQHQVGLIGTIGTYIQGQIYQTKNTTPESYEIQKMMHKMVKRGCEYCIMEVSSQGLMLNRVAGIDFDYGIFTNLSPDHIGENEHHSFEDYMMCKKKLFGMCKKGLFNKDDPYFQKMTHNISCEILTYSIVKDSDLQAIHFEPTSFQHSLGMKFETEGKVKLSIEMMIPGQFNVYNALGAILLCYDLHLPFETIQAGLKNLHVPGRLEIVPVPADYTVMIDYAHNPFAYDHLFQMLKDYHPVQIYCVYGAGGRRDRHRRFEVGAIVAKNHAFSIVTADNPRGEDVFRICHDIVKGIQAYNGDYVVIVDRKEAIHYALKHAQKGAIILCLGKGHEDYQIIDQEPLPFSERKMIEEYFE